MNVKGAESALLSAVQLFVLSGDKAPLLRAAWNYGKAKSKAADNRDRWKRRKRLGESS